jgi:hypothetical protein
LLFSCGCVEAAEVGAGDELTRTVLETGEHDCPTHGQVRFVAILNGSPVRPADG